MIQRFDINAFEKQTLGNTSRLSAKILLFLMLLVSVAMLYNTLTFEKRLNAIRLANSDNRGWVVAQLEVDHQGVMGVLDVAIAGSEELTSETLNLIVQEFDIFYSRVDIFSSTITRLPISDDAKAKVAKLQLTRDSLAAQIDSISVAEIGRIKAFRQSMVDAYPLVREMAVTALQEITLQSARTRDDEERVFIQFFVQSLVLLGLTGLGTYLVINLWHALEARTAETARSAAMLSTVFNSTLNAVIVTDTRLRMLCINEMAQRLLGDAAEHLLSMQLEEVLFLEQDAKGAQSAEVSKWLSLAGKGPMKCIYREANGNERPVEVSLVKNNDLNGLPIIIVFIRDISRQVAAETRLREALKTTQEAAQAKSMFLATMSHEMRTPLHGLMASLELIEEDKSKAANRMMLKTARDCAARALSQVDDVLELTRMGQSIEKSEEFFPSSIAADIVDELKPLARKFDNRLELVTMGPFDLYRLEGRPVAFSRALYNLAGNAVKFTRAGRVIIRMMLEGPCPETLQLRVEVEDNGIGISPADQKRIFENFEAVNRTDIGASTGSGLGLPIAKLAIEQQGGTLDLDSQLGVGSLFHFTIPTPLAKHAVKSAHAPAIKLASQETQSSKRILVVDDNEVNLVLMGEMVRRIGHIPDSACNGKDAVKKANARAYDVILMDVSMPSWMDQALHWRSAPRVGPRRWP
jgi:PAS domain S-box-containing protein